MRTARVSRWFQWTGTLRCELQPPKKFAGCAKRFGSGDRLMIMVAGWGRAPRSCAQDNALRWQNQGSNSTGKWKHGHPLASWITLFALCFSICFVLAGGMFVLVGSQRRLELPHSLRRLDRHELVSVGAYNRQIFTELPCKREMRPYWGPCSQSCVRNRSTSKQYHAFDNPAVCLTAHHQPAKHMRTPAHIRQTSSEYSTLPLINTASHE